MKSEEEKRKANAARQAKLKGKMDAAGLVRVPGLYALREHHKAIKEFALSLHKKARD